MDNDDVNFIKKYNITYKEIIPSDLSKKYNYDSLTIFYLFYVDLFEEMQPDAIVVPHELGYAFYAVQVAKALKIPTYHIQHGLWGANKYDENYYGIKKDIKRIIKKKINFRKVINFLLNTINTGSSNVIPESLKKHKINLISNPREGYPVFADKFALCGPYYEKLTRHHLKNTINDKIEAIGYLRLDNLIREKSITKDQLYKDYGFKEDSKMALYFYSPFQDQPHFYNYLNYDPDKALLDGILTLKKIDNKFNILVLLHPLFKFDYYTKKIRTKLIELKIDRVIVDRARNNHAQLYKNSSIVIGIKSACLYEAMLFNVPVVVQQYVLTKILDPQLFDYGAAAPVFSPDQLEAKIKKALFDDDFRKCMFQNQKKLCTDLMGPFDGKSGVRAAKSILKFISGFDDNTVKKNNKFK
ncbi:hypothetical protein ACFLZ5_03675 [Thermodesulfobacteriota bacterium]